MRVWDWDSNQYIEVEVYHNGKGAMPHELAGRAHWAQIHPPAIGGSERGEHVNKRDVVGKGNADIPFAARSTDKGTGRKCTCGAWVAGVVATRCSRCRRRSTAGRLPHRQACPCCLRWFETRLLTPTHKLCPQCKGKWRPAKESAA